jgi:anti-anti-sigma factor
MREGKRALVLAGELDMAAAPTLGDAVADVCAERPSPVIFDIEGLEFIDSTGLRSLLACRDACEAHGCEVIISRSQGQVERVFEIAGIGDLQAKGPGTEPTGQSEPTGQ